MPSGDCAPGRRKEIPEPQAQKDRPPSSRSGWTGQAELSIALIGNAEMRELNAKFRNKDYATDVLSFGAGEELPAAVKLLGDVVISVEKAQEQAQDKRTDRWTKKW